MTTDRDQLRQERPEPVRRPAPPEDQAVCDLCSTFWPADALQAGVCPDCLDEDEEVA